MQMLSRFSRIPLGEVLVVPQKESPYTCTLYEESTCAALAFARRLTLSWNRRKSIAHDIFLL